MVGLSTQWKTGSRALLWSLMRKAITISMSNSSPSPEAKQSSEGSTTPPEEECGFDYDIPQSKAFPVITIVLSFDDPSEPNHVDLGSVPPQIAAAALARISQELGRLSWPSRVTYAGQTVFDPTMNYTDDDDEDGPFDERV